MHYAPPRSLAHAAASPEEPSDSGRWAAPAPAREDSTISEEQPAGCSSTLEFEAVVSFPQRDRTETVTVITETVGRVESETSL